MKPCRACGAGLHNRASSCPYCGHQEVEGGAPPDLRTPPEVRPRMLPPPLVCLLLLLPPGALMGAVLLGPRGALGGALLAALAGLVVLLVSR
jgi:hypothetical protein